MKNLENKEVGGIGELIFSTAALKKGFIVSKPLLDTRKYDLVLDNRQGRLLRVQIKTTAISSDATDGSFKFNISHGRKGKEAYTTNDIDFFVCYAYKAETFYIIPVSATQGQTTVRINENNSESKFTKYREAWDLFFV